ncbi:RHS repeat-associated core domain-containing protein [Streptomyces sp. NPDC101115]|uniref:RHS repeat-associated core domain-containing protein n=1 Tax=Streptomyces sp. NPDC101115 TaxID=3366106 RepID=UPI003823EC08
MDGLVSQRRPWTWRRARATVLAAMVLSSLLAALPAEAAPPRADRAGRGTPSPVQHDAPVDVTPVEVRPIAPDPAAAAQWTGTPSVSWPAAETADVDLTAWLPGRPSGAVQAGRTPVWIGGVDPARDAASPARVGVTVLSRETAAAAGLPAALLFDLRPTGGGGNAARVAVEVDYSSFRHAFGGDWASRLRLAALPPCASRTPGRAECRALTPVPTRNDLQAGRVAAELDLRGPSTRVALAAAPEGATGDYKATPLAPTANWQVSANSGTFTWNYPMRVPPVPGGLQPSVSLSYSTGTVDGRVAAANNQPSWVGEGWDLWPGYITRSFASCANDTTDERKKTGDQCWAGDHHVSMVNGGRATEFVHDASGAWRPKDDDGSRIELLTGASNDDRFGEHWKVTSPDGTQYFFGSRPERQSTWTVPVFGNDAGEPCHTDTFASSWCQRAWRWNLDHVVDRHGGTISYHYRKETNSYGLNMAKGKAEYTRGGQLERVEYGTGEGVEGPAPARVLFEVADRCAPDADCGQHTSQSYPDVPWDQNCAATAASCPEKYSPTFWTTKRLAKVTTQVRSGTGYADVDSWSLRHLFPLPGDRTSPALWLSDVTHTGLAGGRVSMPPVEFHGEALANRVDSAPDGLPPLNKFRLHAVHNEAGGVLSLGYAPPDCRPSALPTAETNTLRCFPVNWAHDQGQARDDWFHKYVVAQVVQTDRVGGAPSQVTTYEYLDGGAWHYNDNELIPRERRTWSQWRGYERVLERKGDPTDADVVRTEKESRYFRGMHGDRLNPAGGTKPPVLLEDTDGRRVEDTDGLQGFLRGEITRRGPGGPVVTDVITDAWRKQTAARVGQTAAMVRPGRVVTKTALDEGRWRRAEVHTRYDEHGLVSETDDLGDTATAADDRCVRTGYVRNTSRWLLSLVSRKETVAVSCGTIARYPEHAVSDERTFYDGAAWGAPPTAGDPTRTERVVSYRDGVPEYAVKEQARHDVHGRAVETTDALGHRTTTVYEPTTGPAKSTTVTDPLGHTTTTALRVEWGEPQTVTDANGRRTDLSHDPLGRLTGVWKPGRDKGSEGPHLRFQYLLRKDGASAVTTEKLVGSGDYTSQVALYDGLLRPRQTQKAAWGGGRVVTDTLYDSRGLAVHTNNPYNTTGAQGPDLVKADPIAVPSQVLTEYDGAERVTASVTKTPGREWRTVTRHHGDHTDVVPPAGGTTTSTYVDARGRTTQLRQFHGTEPLGAHDTTSYTYAKGGEVETVTDAAGNVLRYVHDLSGLRIEAHDPDKGTTRMTYDNAGQLRTRTDSRGKTTVHSYDALGRRTAVRSGSESGPLLAEWTYDTVPDDSGRPLKGLLASSVRHTDEGAYRTVVTGYDAGNRTTGTVLTLPEGEAGLPRSYESVTAYHPDGSLASRRLPQVGDLPAETLVYRYDALGLLKTLTSSAGQYIKNMHYTAFGEPARLSQGPEGGSLWQSTYYEPGTRRVERTLTERESGSLRVDETTYGYDPVGNVTRIRSDSPDGLDTQCFVHDHLRRTKEAWTPAGDCQGAPGSTVGGPAPYWAGFTYDPAGNRRTETRHGLAGATDTVRTYHYPEPGTAQPHTVRSVTTTGPKGGPATGSAAPVEEAQVYAYSPTGATTLRPGPSGRAQKLTWDAEDRLTTVEEDGRTTSYVYDTEGTRLITRDVGGRTLHLPVGELRADTTGGRLRGTRYYADGKDRIIAVRVGTRVSYQVSDLHGTGTVAVDAMTLAPTRRRLDPFGLPRRVAAGPDTVQPALPGRRGFVGGTEDAVTGLTRLGARDYDPGTGKFLSVDPMVNPMDPQSLNGFAYSNNNPASFNDSTGLSVCALVDSPGGARCINTGLTRPPLRIENVPPSSTYGHRCLGPLRCDNPLDRKPGGFGRMDLCSERASASSAGCAAMRDRDREARQEAEKQRRAREAAERREAARRNMQGSVMECTSFSVSLFIVGFGFEYCSGHDAAGPGGSFSVKVSGGWGLPGVSVAKMVKGSEGGIDEPGTLTISKDLSATTGHLGIGIDGSVTTSTRDGTLTGGTGMSWGIGGPRVSAGVEFGWSFR